MPKDHVSLLLRDRPKVASCLPCRRSKLRCDRDPENSICRRCASNPSLDCVTPEFRLGRKKGSKNKSKDDRPFFSSTTTYSDTPPFGDVGARPSSSHSQSDTNHTQSPPRATNSDNSIPKLNIPASNKQLSPFPWDTPIQTIGFPVPPVPSLCRKAPQRVHGAENPLGLLASVSESVVRTPSLTNSQRSSNSSMYNYAYNSKTSQTLHDNTLPGLSIYPQDRRTAFGTFFAGYSFPLDVSEDTDPLCLGLVNEAEASFLFDIYINHLSHTRWGMDTDLYTLDFVRRRSSFLFTAMITSASNFVEGFGAISKRLHSHLQKLTQKILLGSYQSVEIVLGLLTTIAWLNPSRHVNEDPTTKYLAIAMNMGLDLCLDKTIRNPTPLESTQLPQLGSPRRHRQLLGSDAICPKKALVIDGFPDLDPTSCFAKRLLRSRQRVWMALWVLDRGVALARGRFPIVPCSASIKCSKEWTRDINANVYDPALTGTIALRLGLDDLIARTKAISNQHLTDQSAVAKARELIDEYFNDWHKEWVASILTVEGEMPPYLDILVHHTRLSVYGAVVNYVASTTDDSRYFCSSGLSAALNVMRVMVQGRKNLKCCPNNLALMVAFAVCFALSLITQKSTLASWIEPGVRTLIRQTLDCLEYIGTTPAHRNGISAIYAKHLKEYLNQTPNFNTENDSSVNGNNNDTASHIALSVSSSQQQSYERPVSPLSPLVGSSFQIESRRNSSPYNDFSSQTTRSSSANCGGNVDWTNGFGQKQPPTDRQLDSSTESTASFSSPQSVTSRNAPLKSQDQQQQPPSSQPRLPSGQNNSNCWTDLSNMTDSQIVDTVNQLDPNFDLGLFTTTGMEWVDWLGWGCPSDDLFATVC